MKKLLSLSLILCSVLSFAQIVSVTNLADSGPGSLRQAYVSANEGDTIMFSPSLLAAGSDTLKLQTSITFTKGLTVIGVNTATDTLYISGQDSIQIFHVNLEFATNKTIRLENLTLINGNAPSSGGGLYATNCDSVLLDHMSFKRNSCPAGFSGGGLYAENCVLKVQNSFFKLNSTIGFQSIGGAMYAGNSDTRISNCYFEQNTSPRGGGVRAFGGTVRIESSDFYSNTSTEPNNRAAGGVAVLSAQLQIEDSHFELNSGTDGGGLSGGVLNGDSSTVKNCRFVNNVTTRDGGGASLRGGNKLIVENCSFEGNQSTTTYQYGGGGALAVLSSDIDLKDLAVFNNVSASAAGGIMVHSDSALSVINCSIVDNQASTSGGGVVLDAYNGDTVICSIINTTIAYNQSPQVSCADYWGVYSNTLGNSIFLGGTDFINNLTQSVGYNIYLGSKPFSGFRDLSLQFVTDLDLDSLADNGGIGMTRVPSLNSVAFNSGKPNDYSDALNGPVIGVRDRGAADRRVYRHDTASGCNPVSWLGNTYSGTGVFTDTAYNAFTIEYLGYLHLVGQDTSVSIVQGSMIANEADSGTQYQWVDCSNSYSPVSGATSASFMPTVNGTYAVIIANGTCVDTSACYSYNEVSLIENDQEGHITFYPNPADSYIHLEANGEYPDEMILLDLSGRVIHKQSIQEDIISLPSLSDGVYVIQWLNKEQLLQSSRLVISKG